MTDIATLLKPKPLGFYEEFVKPNNEISLSLSQQEAAVVLKAYDHGLNALNEDETHLINCVLASVKHQLWP